MSKTAYFEQKLITIIRHGMPEAHNKYSNWTILRGSDLSEFINDWNNCELSLENKISDKLRVTIDDSDFFVTSKLRRTIDSSRLLGIMKADTSELLNEAELPHGFLKNIRMPVILWGGVIRLAWVFGLRMNAESYKEFKTRIKKACTYISLQSVKSNHIAVIGHGFANMQIKKELKRNKWKHIENCGGYDYWSFDTFEKSN